MTTANVIIVSRRLKQMEGDRGEDSSCDLR